MHKKKTQQPASFSVLLRRRRKHQKNLQKEGVKKKNAQHERVNVCVNVCGCVSQTQARALYALCFHGGKRKRKRKERKEREREGEKRPTRNPSLFTCS